MNHVFDLAKEPRVEAAGGVHLVNAEAIAERFGHQQKPIGRRLRQGRGNRLPGVAIDFGVMRDVLHPRDRRFIEAG